MLSLETWHLLTETVFLANTKQYLQKPLKRIWFLIFRRTGFSDFYI